MLTCSATGFPAPVVTWFINNTMKDSSSYVTETINFYTTSSIFVKAMAEANDSGIYSCRAATDGYDNVDSNMATVLVQGKYLFPNVEIAMT